ncbi:hydantoinase B/oxoprolinase family protein [Saccharopolyspora sp. NPDC050642]|uniref:hydantoinase B/oxoprolinase family protein n=1 Tax=Saccharopolyspora sp. NPDC050642 TaxID=3157099 RepID=UPI0033DAC266
MISFSLAPQKPRFVLASGLTPLVGTGRDEAPTVVFFMDHCGGAGGGAQSSFDGLDLYGMTISPGIGLPSIGVNESTQPALHLWRTLNANSGGPGVHRGGLSMESAWAVYGSDGPRLRYLQVRGRASRGPAPQISLALAPVKRTPASSMVYVSG